MPQQAEFAEAMKLLLEQNGFTKVKVTTALFAKKADISCRDKMGRKRQLIRKQKKQVQYEPVFLKINIGGTIVIDFEFMRTYYLR